MSAAFAAREIAIETRSQSLFEEEEEAFNAALKKADRALEALLNVPSSNIQELAGKVAVLDREYPDAWQKRHIIALKRDIQGLAETKVP